MPCTHAKNENMEVGMGSKIPYYALCYMHGVDIEFVCTPKIDAGYRLCFLIKEPSE